jgi:hypothetical protein
LSVDDPYPLHQKPEPSDCTVKATLPLELAELAVAVIWVIEQGCTEKLVVRPLNTDVNVQL